MTNINTEDTRANLAKHRRRAAAKLLKLRAEARAGDQHAAAVLDAWKSNPQTRNMYPNPDRGRSLQARISALHDAAEYLRDLGMPGLVPIVLDMARELEALAREARH